MEEDKKINISLIQMNSKIGDKKANYDKVQKLAESIGKTDIIVLPEVWTSGWSPKHFRSCADNIENNETTEFLSSLAKKLDAWIIGGSYIQKIDNETFYNRCPVLNRKGDLIAYYDKCHLFTYYGDNEGNFVKAGETPVIVNIEGINVGLSVCFDIRFTELYRAYRKAGAELFVNCAAWGSKKPIPWEMMTKSRAIENQTYMAALTQSGYIEDDKFNLGHSRIIDYNGNVLSEILEGEGVISSDLKFKEMYEFRDKCTILKDIKKSYEVKFK